MTAFRFRRKALHTWASVLVGGLMLGGCQELVDSRYAKSLPPTHGGITVQGLSDNVSIRRNPLGMPLIESNSFHDALFALGYVHASDRLSQMINMRLMAQGRLSERAGPGTLEIDRFMRSLQLKRSAALLYQAASPRLQAFFEVYARGVNAYLYQQRNNLPLDLQGGPPLEYWQAEDSALIFCLLNFGLSLNLQEEVASLVLSERLDPQQLAWLLPTYPDEDLPFDETAKLKGLQLGQQGAALHKVQQTLAAISGINLLGVAASNNWAIAPQRSRSGKSLLANDTHLPISLPSTWNFVQILAPGYRAAGVSIAGIPAIVAGFNGKLAWGMTMVMGDNQDLFLEQLREANGQLQYLDNGQWKATQQRKETFLVKGQPAIEEVFHETRNGALIERYLGTQKHSLQPLPWQGRYGLALQSTRFEPDQSLDAFFDLSRAQSVEKAHQHVRRIQAINLNLVYADAEHIAWQVTGRYPNRRGGRGLVPSPGWVDDYRWDGFAEPMLFPYDQDPQQGWLGTANHRTVSSGYGLQLSNSWYYPERAERIAQLAEASRRHDLNSMKAMQYDQTSLFVAKLQAMFTDPIMDSALRQAIAALPEAQRNKADEALRRLLGFDGKLSANSADAALYGVFLQESAKQIFLDELGPEDSPTWQAFVLLNNTSYSAPADHLLGRFDSPFWNDVNSPGTQDKPTILARSLVASIDYLERTLGADRQAWQWGKLHTYHWQNDASRLSAHLPATQRAALNSLDSYLNRGPWQAGGDHNTLNVSAYNWGQDFDTWLIPSMRLIVDFAAPEPFIGVNSSGQSGNPASPHYADGIEAWLKGQYMTFPFQAQNLDLVYGKQRLVLRPPATP